MPGCAIVVRNYLQHEALSSYGQPGTFPYGGIESCVVQKMEARIFCAFPYRRDSEKLGHAPGIAQGRGC